MPNIAVNIEYEVKRRGITTDVIDFECIRGCVINMDQRFHIFISSTLDPIKKRMCVAHELSHIDDDTVDGVHVFLAEKRAYKMAREKLIPCKALLEMMSDGFTDYRSLASIFGVSEKMIQLRCQDLSIL